LKSLEKEMGAEFNSIIDSNQLVLHEKFVAKNIELLVKEGPFATFHNADFTLAKICYLFIKILKPEKVIETGVAYGVTTSFILKAMDENKIGELYSIDLPPLGKAADRYVGYLVPNDLKSRWHLYRGKSKKLLPSIVKDIKSVDIFIHDSLHTLENIRFELEHITPYLKKPGLIIADDVDGNSAFYDWAERAKPDLCVVCKEQTKKSKFAIAFFR